MLTPLLDPMATRHSTPFVDVKAVPVSIACLNGVKNFTLQISQALSSQASSNQAGKPNHIYFCRWHQMDVDWTNPPSQSSESLSRIATKPRRARSKKHSAYSESDEDDCVISDTEGESDDQEDRPGLQPAQKRVYSIDRYISLQYALL